MVFRFTKQGTAETFASSISDRNGDHDSDRERVQLWTTIFLTQLYILILLGCNL